MKSFTRVAIVEAVGMPDKIDGDIQIVRQEIGALKAAAKGEAPSEVRVRPGGVTGRLNRGGGAGPIEIGLEIAERADREVERRRRWCKIGATYPPAASQALRAVVAQSLMTGRHAYRDPR
jgi:hypothetical protein